MKRLIITVLSISTFVIAVDKTSDIQPYEFAIINDPGFNVGTTHIYKTVHQGCELFIAIDSSGSSDHGRGIAIATGRGCR